MNPENIIYLDHAAATPLDEGVFAVMQPYFSQLFFNPSSPYVQAVQVRRAYEDAKSRLARTFGAKGDEIVMTAGATESINLALGGTDGHIVTSSIEHPAVLEAARLRSHTIVDPKPDGIVSPDSVAEAITPDTTLVTVALANSELGTIQSIRAIAECVSDERKRRSASGSSTPIWLHCDASQGFGLIDTHVSRLGVDMLTLNAGKIYGPKQVGLLWTKSSVRLQPLIAGGGQERGLRSGTENVAGVIGFAEAAERAVKKQSSESKRLSTLRDRLKKQLLEAYPEALVLGNPKRQLPSHLSMAFADIDAERLIFLLEARGICVATGSACSANKHTASPVLRAIGVDDQHINGSLRMTFGRLNDDEQIDQAAQVMIEALRSEYKRMS